MENTLKLAAAIDQNTTVLSTDFGQGEVVGIREKFDGVEDYYVVECGNTRMKNYIPVKNVKNFRYLSTRSEVEAAIHLLDDKAQPEKDFPSKKERLIYFKEAFKVHEINSIVKAVNELHSIDDLGTTEVKLLDKLIDTLVLEVSLVFKIDQAEARSLILKRLPA